MCRGYPAFPVAGFLFSLFTFGSDKNLTVVGKRSRLFTWGVAKTLLLLGKDLERLHLGVAKTLPLRDLKKKDCLHSGAAKILLLWGKD